MRIIFSTLIFCLALGLGGVSALAQSGLWGDEPLQDINTPEPALDASSDDDLDDGLVIPGEAEDGSVTDGPPGFYEAVASYQEEDFEAACETWLELANQGHGSSQHNVAVCLEHGRGMPVDTRQAAGWYWQAVEHDIPEAMNNLAKLHTDGRGVAQDHHLAANLYAKAANLDLVDAQYNLAAAYYRGLGLAQNAEQAFIWMQRAAEAGHVRAQYDLGGFFVGGVGTPENMQQAAYWYDAAMAQGDAAATYAVGYLHYRGTGVAQDLARAFTLIEQAAQAGVVSAQNQLGVMSAKGEGADRDPISAYRWFHVAAGMGDEAAGRNRDRLKSHLTPSQIKQAEDMAQSFEPVPVVIDLLSENF